MKVSDDMAFIINSVLARTTQDALDLAKAYRDFKQSPSPRVIHNFGQWLSTAMMETNINHLVSWVKEKHEIEISPTLVTRWRKGYELVPWDKIGPLFDYFCQHSELGITSEDILEGKRTMLNDILRQDRKLRELLGERINKISEQWIDIAFPKHRIRPARVTKRGR
jgi:hypothetical protein